ncbi:MAG: GAF domain-containing protein, partial [Anaerolineales bacterium]|nr:GAF domain-containing protein [Anaerolineales bacterium]
DPVNDLLSFPYFVDQYDQPPLPEKAGHGLTAYVLRTGHSLLAPAEVFNQLVRQGEVELVGTNSVDWLGVPLNVEGKIIGVMVTQSYTEGIRFSQEDADLLTFVSTQVAMAIERKRAEEALQRQLKELNVLHTATLAGAQSTSVDELIERVTQIIGESLFPDNCGVLLFDETANVLRPHPSYHGVSNEENRHISIPPGKGVSGKVAASRRPLRIADVNREKNYLKVNMEMRSELCVPILVGERLLGVLNAESNQLNFFTEADERLLVTIAGGLANAIEKMRLFDTERIRRLEAEMLSQAAAALTSSLELDQVLDNLLISLAQVIPYDSTAVFIQKNERLRIVAGRGFSTPEKVIGQTFPADDPLSQALRESRRPILIADVRADSRFQSWGDTRAVRGWMGVPLIVRDQVIGYLTIDSHSLNAYNEAQANLALAFANQAAAAIENAHLYTSLSNEKQRLELLYNLSRRLTESLDSHQIATKALDHICTALGAFKGVIYVPRPEIDRWELLAASGMKPAEIEAFNQYAGVPLTSGLTGWAASHKKTAVVPDVAKDKRWLTVPGLDEWVRSAMATPLLAGNTIIGVLNLLSDQIAAFREEDVEIVQAAAAPLAVALQNARLYAAEKRRAERLVELSKLGVEIAALHEASAVLNILVTRAAAIMESATCTVMLIDTSTNEAVLAAQTGLPEGTLPELRIPLELPLLRHSVESSQPIIIPDINHDAPAMRAVLLRPDIHAFFAYPMLREGRAIGFITFSKLTPHTPSEEEVAACHLLAERAAVALENVRLFEETTRSLNQVQALHTIDMTIASSFDLRLTLNILLEQTKTQLGVDAVDALIYSPHTQMLDYAAGIGFRTTALQGTHLRLGQGYAGIAGLERKTIHISNLREHKMDFLRSPYFSAEEFDTYFGLPLIAKGQLKGVLEVFQRSPLQPNQNWMDFLETLAKQAAIAIDNASLFSDLQSSNTDLILAYNATIEGWSKALDLRDKETEGHTLRVTEMTLQLARGMGMGEAEIAHVRRGALLHDIGKMGIPDSILHNPGPLTDEEWAIMRRHPQYAFEMLSPIAYLRPALDIPSYHHEKWDGTGYPRGLKGEQIPLAARIFAVVDVYDALTSDRPYRKAWPEKKALNYIREQSEKHFDPQVVEAFLSYSKQ